MKQLSETLLLTLSKKQKQQQATTLSIKHFGKPNAVMNSHLPPANRNNNNNTGSRMVPAHELCELLKAGDVEANPEPVCEECDRTVKTGTIPLECREGGCHVVCHKQLQCSGQRRGCTELWSYNAYRESRRSEGTERAPMPTVRSARTESRSRCCIKLCAPAQECSAQRIAATR